MEEEDTWEMHEPKDGFSKQDEKDLFKMLKNMPVEGIKSYGNKDKSSRTSR
jgi:hypothetical protein